MIINRVWISRRSYENSESADVGGPVWLVYHLPYPFVSNAGCLAPNQIFTGHLGFDSVWDPGTADFLQHYQVLPEILA